VPQWTPQVIVVTMTPEIRHFTSDHLLSMPQDHFPTTVRATGQLRRGGRCFDQAIIRQACFFHDELSTLVYLHQHDSFFSMTGNLHLHPAEKF